MPKGLLEKGSAGQINQILAIKDPPYVPSWVDRFNAWVERLPIPPFAAFLILYVVLSPSVPLSDWLFGLTPFWTIDIQAFQYQVFTFEAFYFNFLFFGISLHALERFRPILDISEEHYKRLQYEFAVLPAKSINFLTLVAIVASVLFAYFNHVIFGGNPLTWQGMVVSFVGWILGLISVAVLLYRMVHQMQKVNEVYTLAKEIDLYNLGPIYALSTFMSRTSLVFLFILYSNMVFDPNNFEIAGFILGSMALSLVALAGFVLPLLGINRRLVSAKTRKMQESNREVRVAFERLSKEQATNKLKNIGNTRQLIDAVIRKREYIQAISTWPWQSATLRNLLAAVFLPVMIWLIQQALNRLIN